jgi:molybdenum cofactor cytidylyltransferase
VAIAILPAAGASRRMGRPKLLLPFRGGTVVGALVQALRLGGVSGIVLVTAPDDEALRAWAAAAAVRTAVNPDPERGMLSSIQAGIALISLASNTEPLLVCPADLPALRAETVAAVLAAAGASPLTVATHRGRRGHPLVIAPALIPEIGTLHAGVGLRELLDRHPVREVEVDDPGAVHDVDTPEEYRELAGEPP